MKKYDVMMLGSGHATWHGALKLAQSGKKVALIEGDTIFGTCTNYGCNAKMLLDGPADVLHQANAYRGVGLDGDLKIDWPALMKYKHQVLDADPDHKQIRESFPKMGVDIIDGWGQIKDEHHIVVDDEEYETEFIVIGTGLRPSQLDVPGKEYMRDSREFLDLPEMPSRMTIIGAGIISYEFAALANAAGAEVTIINHSDRPLRQYYSKYVKKLTNQLKKSGITFEMNQTVKEVTKDEDGLHVKTDEGLDVATDYVLDATGRIANVEKIGLEQLGIQVSSKGIFVDDHLRTAVPNIFASGDVIDKKIPKLTPTAWYESEYIAKAILNEQTPAIQYPPVAEVIFSLPRLAQVGVSVDEAKQNDDYQIKRVPYGSVVFETKNEPHAEATIVMNQAGQVVGATVLGNQAGPLINMLTMMVAKQMRPSEIDSEMIMAFPDESFGLFQILNGGLPS